MGILREEHDILETKVYNRFSELLAQQEQGLIFATDDENYDDCDIVEVYDEINGGTFSVYVVGITKGGMIEGKDVEDGRAEDYRMTDLNSTLDRISVVELLENFTF